MKGVKHSALPVLFFILQLLRARPNFEPFHLQIAKITVRPSMYAMQTMLRAQPTIR
jgi:hypothetical protein